MALGDVVDQLHDQHGFADTGAAEQADFTALGVGGQQIYDLNAGDQLLGLRRLLAERGGRTVNRRALGGVHRPAIVDWVADHVHNAPQHFRANRHGDGRAGSLRLVIAGQALGGVHRDGAHTVLAQMLCHLQHQQGAVTALDMQSIENRRDLAIELYVHDRAHHLGDPADSVFRHGGQLLTKYGRLP